MLHALLTQVRPGEDAAEAAAYDGDVDGVVTRAAPVGLLDVGIGGVVAELGVCVPVLGGAVGPDAPLALIAVALAQCGGLVGGR